MFDLGAGLLESLEQELEKVEFAVLVITRDDTRTSRGREREVPRDNVVFELGLFMGKLGRRRAFAICDQNADLPTDLLGVSIAKYDPRRRDGSIRAAVSPACTEILRAVKEAPRLSPGARTPLSDQIFLDEDALAHAVSLWHVSDAEKILVARRDTEWFWRLFPSVLRWRMKGLQVVVLAEQPRGDDLQRRKETNRRRLLRDLGVQLRVRRQLKITGFFLNSRYPDEAIAIEVNEGEGESRPLAVRYNGRTHSKAVAALLDVLPSIRETAQDRAHVPTLEAHQADDVCRRLREGVSQYSPDSVHLTAAVLRPEELRVVSPFARAFKYHQIEYLAEEYDALGLETFCPLNVVLASGRRSVVTPPVVEMWPGGPVVIEGKTRATFSYKTQREGFHCIQVSGVRDALPGESVPIEEATIVQRALSPQEKTPRWAYSRFRHIERAIHPY